MKVRYIERYWKYNLLKTMFYLTIYINFLLDYNILIEIDHVLAGENTTVILPDQSKLFLYHKKLSGFNRGAIKIENTSSQ